MNRRPWTEHELGVVRRNYPHFPTKQIAEQLGRTIGQVYSAAERLGLRKTDAYLASDAACRLRRGEGVGIEHRFAKGMTPWNKGLAGSTGLHPNTAAHHFRPGAISGRAARLVHPLGTLRINADGVLERKVAETPGPSHVRWHPIHRLVWEAAHGPVPSGHVVVFCPGLKTTKLDEITLDRLECITRAENMRRNSTHRHGIEIHRLAQLRGAITRQINKRLREQAK